MTRQLDLELARAEGDRAMQAAASAGERVVPNLTEHAAAYMLSVLVTTRAELTGEQLVDKCRAAGFCPPDDRSFGMAFRRLITIGARVVGSAPRVKGHGSGGAKVYSA